MIENFEKNEHVLTIKYFHEIGKKLKNRKHFILTVLKVGQGKKKIIFVIFGRFHDFFDAFWKNFLKKMSTFWPPQKKFERGAKSKK